MDSILSICKGLRELALFAGAGGGILGGHLLGWRTVCAVEIEPYCQSVLCKRQNEGLLFPFPVWDDIRTFDGKPWKGVVDVVSGGFPCQDISSANPNGAGIEGKKSGLWKEMFRIICEVRPVFCYMENSPLLTTRGLSAVLGDLAAVGYNATWGVMGGRDVGAVHWRKRIWILGMLSDHFKTRQSKQDECCQYEEGESGNRMCIENRKSCESWNHFERAFSFERFKALEYNQKIKGWRIATTQNNFGGLFESWWKVEPRVGRMVDGVANRMDRIAALGNGQIPAVAALMFCLLLERMLKNEQRQRKTN